MRAKTPLALSRSSQAATSPHTVGLSLPCSTSPTPCMPRSTRPFTRRTKCAATMDPSGRAGCAMKNNFGDFFFHFHVRARVSTLCARSRVYPPSHTKTLFPLFPRALSFFFFSLALFHFSLFLISHWSFLSGAARTTTRPAPPR